MKLLNPKDFVKEYSIKSLAACFSGGKDSLVSTHFVMSELEGEDDIDKHVVFVDTGAMLPISEPFVRDVCQQYGWNLTVLNGGFFEKAKKFGMPRMRHRWCCYECKLKPIIEFVQTLERHMEGIEAYFKHIVTNALAESLNARIQVIKRIAKGYKNK